MLSKLDNKTLDKNDSTFKLILTGNSSVGKSSLVNLFTGKHYLSSCSTIGAAFHNIRRKYQDADGKDAYYQLHVWDTAGQERFRSITKIYYKGSNIILLVYDLTLLDSLTEIRDYWLPDIFHNTYIYDNDQLLIYLIGNKQDIYCDNLSFDSKRKKIIQEIQTQYPQIRTFEVSAKSEYGIHELICDIYQTLDTIMRGPPKALPVEIGTAEHINIIPCPEPSGWRSWKWKCW